jgi:uncharacterized protein (TIGR00106 family)
MSVLIEFSMFPTDKTESVSPYVSRIIKAIDESGVNYKLTPMGTVFETETLDEALNIIRLSHEQLSPDCGRTYMNLKMDYRKGQSNRLTKKIESIENKLGKSVKK